jgi:hypothetical protein
MQDYVEGAGGIIFTYRHSGIPSIGVPRSSLPALECSNADAAANMKKQSKFLKGSGNGSVEGEAKRNILACSRRSRPGREKLSLKKLILSLKLCGEFSRDQLWGFWYHVGKWWAAGDTLPSVDQEGKRNKVLSLQPSSYAHTLESFLKCQTRILDIHR